LFPLFPFMPQHHLIISNNVRFFIDFIQLSTFNYLVNC